MKGAIIENLAGPENKLKSQAVDITIRFQTNKIASKFNYTACLEKYIEGFHFFST